ncbi:MAG: type I restriction enzyme HsdR N-terminal domain-containing protein [Chlamydiota bacterium]
MTIFDPYRGRLVVETPEEIVRQSCLKLMVEELGYPSSLIAVEKSLKELLKTSKPPLRRADILVFSLSGEPLLLIECKAVPLTLAMQRQVRGYNYYIKAPFIALINDKEALFSTKGGAFEIGIRPYEWCLFHASIPPSKL